MCHPSSISSLLHLTCANGDIDVEHKGSERQHAHTLAQRMPDNEVISELTCKPDSSD